MDYRQLLSRTPPEKPVYDLFYTHRCVAVGRLQRPRVAHCPEIVEERRYGGRRPCNICRSAPVKTNVLLLGQLSWVCAGCCSGHDFSKIPYPHCQKEGQRESKGCNGDRNKGQPAWNTSCIIPKLSAAVLHQLSMHSC